MVLEAFSQSVGALYRLSADMPPRNFSFEVVRLLRSLIPFDGALFKFGSNVVRFDDNESAAELASAHTTALLLEKCGVVFTRKTLSLGHHAQSKPLICQQRALLENFGSDDLSQFASVSYAQSLMFYGSAVEGTGDANWIVIYRKAEVAFSETESTFLQNYWSHIRQACALNLTHLLNNNTPGRNSRTLGLLNMHGRFEVADAALIELLKEEWLNFDGHTLPAEAMSVLLAQNTFHGLKIELLSNPNFGYLVCEAKRVAVFNVLAPGEKKVAFLFSTGLSNGKIADQLGVSAYTVRNQLAQIYQKLGIHSKAQLASMIARL